MTDDNRRQLKNRAIIVGLVLLFSLPILVSWYLVFFTDFNHGEGGYEHGELITPARKLPDKMLVDPLTGESKTLHGKWTMLASVRECENGCAETLYTLRQIRLAMGRERGRLQRAAYFTRDINSGELQTLFADYTGQLILPETEVDPGFLQALDMRLDEPAGSIRLIDPAGFYMMIYPPDAEPGGIIKDLKRLLRISKLD